MFISRETGQFSHNLLGVSCTKIQNLPPKFQHFYHTPTFPGKSFQATTLFSHHGVCLTLFFLIQMLIVEIR